MANTQLSIGTAGQEHGEGTGHAQGVDGRREPRPQEHTGMYFSDSGLFIIYIQSNVVCRRRLGSS